MTQGIALLPDEVVNLIAAGEVLDAIAAVVRELVENSLDAGATRITIAVWLDQWRVRVADNGAGMGLDDLAQAAAAHSTSKIRDRQDLRQITSLGFRGEALHSLAQLANLQIASRCIAASNHPLPPTAELSSPCEGWCATYDRQGGVQHIEPVAIAPGTIVTADQIFANLPERRQGLPAPAQQLRAIQLVIQHLALAHPHVTWQVQQNDQDWFTLFPGKTARQMLPQILRNIQESDLQELSYPCSQVALAADRAAGETAGEISRQFAVKAPLYLLLGLPDRCHRHRPDWVKIIVNGRFVQVPELEQTVLTAFRRMLPRDRFPVCLVQLQIAPDQIDWHRHPAKTTIYLHDVERWRTAIAEAIDQTLRLHPGTIPDSLHSTRVGHLFKTAEMSGSYSLAAAAAPTSPEPASSQVPLQVLAQVHNTYILVEHPTGIWLIEQHIAHERVLYEALCDRWQLVPLASPVILNGLTSGQQEQLQRIGIGLEPFGEQAWVVREVPGLLATRADCAEALLELSLGGDLSAAQAAIACRSAIRNGTPLTQTEMQDLVNQWQQTRNPRTCPHGRPICLTLEESSLARFFRRHWMIGKSHGI